MSRGTEPRPEGAPEERLQPGLPVEPRAPLPAAGGPEDPELPAAQEAPLLPPLVLAPHPRRAEDPTLAALLELLDDPSPTVWQPVWRALRERGSAAVPALRAAARSQRPQLRARARSILLGHDRRRRLRRLMAYVARPRFRLETALFLLSGVDRPRFDRRPYVHALDDLAELVRGDLGTWKSPMDRALCLPRYLGQRFRYRPRRTPSGTPEPSHHPSQVLLDRVLEGRNGLPLSLALVWRLAADRMLLPLEIIGIPGHALVRVDAGPRRLLLDPANGGEEVSRRAVRDFLEAHGIPYGPDLFQPLSDRALLRRQVANWMRGLGARGQHGRAEELIGLHGILDRP